MFYKKDFSPKKRFKKIVSFAGFILLSSIILFSANTSFGKEFSDYFKKIKIVALEKNPETGYMSNFVVDANGHFLFVDCGAHNVIIYDNDGKLLKPLGRAGKGPGEFDCPISGNIDPSGNIYICDNGWREMIIFHPDFEFRKSFFITGRHFMPKEFGFLSDGNIVMSGYFENFNKPMTGDNLELYSHEGKFIKSFCSIPDFAKRNMLAYYSRAHFSVSADDKIYVVQETEYKIRVYNKDGRLLRTFGREGKFYVPPAHFPEYEKFVRLKDEEKKKLYQSWTPYKKLFIHHNQFIILSLATNRLAGVKTDYLIEIYDLDGNQVVSEIGTNMRLLDLDKKGNFYFLNWTNQNETEDIPAYKIEKCTLKRL